MMTKADRVAEADRFLTREQRAQRENMKRAAILGPSVITERDGVRYSLQINRVDTVNWAPTVIVRATSDAEAKQVSVEWSTRRGLMGSWRLVKRPFSPQAVIVSYFEVR